MSLISFTHSLQSTLNQLKHPISFNYNWYSIYSMYGRWSKNIVDERIHWTDGNMTMSESSKVAEAYCRAWYRFATWTNSSDSSSVIYIPSNLHCCVSSIRRDVWKYSFQLTRVKFEMKFLFSRKFAYLHYVSRLLWELSLEIKYVNKDSEKFMLSGSQWKQASWHSCSRTACRKRDSTSQRVLLNNNSKLFH